MDIAVYALLTRKPNGELALAECRNGSKDIPIGFEPRYADFLFEFAESRIKCHDSEQVYLAKGIINTDDINSRTKFVQAFKNKALQKTDFSDWEILQSKVALSPSDSFYKNKLLQHLRARRIIGEVKQAS